MKYFLESGIQVMLIVDLSEFKAKGRPRLTAWFGRTREQVPVIFALASAACGARWVGDSFNDMFQFENGKKIISPFDTEGVELGGGVYVCGVEKCPVNIQFRHVLESVMFR